jgi:catechol 2,3-dioxygenase-like lactoylglutathione lyase family enzyme
MIKGLHHNAYRCRDSEETRRFYEEFLGLPLAATLEIETTKTERTTRALHTFYALGGGAFLAFFEVPEQPFQFKAQNDYDLHIALEVDETWLAPMLERARGEGVEARGVADHGFLRSIYLRDPNGYVIELAALMPRHEHAVDPTANGARAVLDRWQAAKTRSAPKSASLRAG